MSLISELGPITGANTRSEDLFVIVNLIQGDDGTKNITRKELVQALQYEIFNNIKITGGTISNVIMSVSTLNDVVINDSEINNGTMAGTALDSVSIEASTANNIVVTSSVITGSEFNDGTGNNVVLTNSTIDDSTILNSSANNMAINSSDFSNGTGDNNIFTNSQVDNSSFANVAIEQGTANGLILTNITIDEIVLEDALMSNSVIITTDFSNGTIRDTAVSNVTIVDTDISNSDIRDTDLDNVTITNSRFANGLIWDTTTSNSSIIDSTANNIVITNSVLNDSTANNVQITNSDFSDGTGNNNVFTNTTIQDGILANNVITNSSFQGTLDNVTAQNMTITSSSTDGLVQNKSKIVDAVIEDSAVSNSSITESELVDFDMNLTKEFEPMLDEDSYFALKNVKTGETEKMTYRQLYDEFSRKTEKSLKVHVASDGNDAYDGTILKPVRTLKRAEQLALEKAGGSYDRNDINNAVHISVGPGTYYVDEPVMLPDDTSMTSTGGQYATLIQKKKGWEKTNGILVGSGCYVQGFSYMNFEVDNFDQPTGGFAIAYRPGALLRRSPYLRDSTQLSNFNRLDVEPPLNPFNSKGTILDLGQEFYLVAGHSAQNLFEVDDEVTFSSGATGYVSYIDDIDSARQIYIRNLKGNVEVGDILYAQRGGQGTIESIGIDDFPNRLVGRGGGCLLADRAVLDTDSLYTYVLCFGFTPRTQNGTGYVAKNGAGVNGIGSLSIFTRQAFFALDGGQMTLNNSGSQFGDISMRARGSTVIIRPAEATQANLISNTAFADVLVEKSDEIIDDMVYYLTSNTASGGLGYQGYNADKCFRDTGIIVDNTGYDIATDGNYWGRLNGISYRSPISYLVVNEQLTETAGSINHLKDSIASVNGGIFANATTELTDRINTSLNETLNILQNGEAAAEPIIFAETGTAGQAAREVVQSNRDLIINDFVSWIDNNDEFYAYDSAKCERDVQEYILPAVKFDMMLDTNYNTENAGLAYYVNTARTSLENQRNETVASFKRLRKTTDELIQANSAPAATSAYSAFNNVIDTIAGSGDKYTPTKATYDPTTGMMVITIGAHDLTVGRYVNLAEESFTFTCSSDNFKTKISHPRKSEKAYLAALPIVAASAKTITVNPGLTAANFEHRFVEASDNAVSVIGQLLTYSDNVGISVDKRNARKQLQANKEYIQDYMMQWAEDEWYFYDSKKCHRDTEEYILPAVQRDLILGTNYNAIQTGAAYRTKSGEVSVTEQLEQTVGSIDYLKARAATFIGDDSIAVDRTNASFDEMSRLLNNNGKKYTPTNAVYDPAIGSVVMTIGSNDFNIGDEIYIEPHSLVFTCALDSNATKHAYPANQFLNFTPTNATYDVATGEFSATIGTHTLKVGDKVEFKPSSIVFNCALDGYITNHPAPESHHPFYKKQITIEKVDATKIYMNVGGIVDGGGLHTFVSASDNCIQAEKIHPAYKKPVTISARTSTSITVNVGESSDTSVHTFVSATNNAIREAGMWTGKFTPQAATYSPVTGELEITIGQHDLPVGKWIQIAPESMVFSCDVGGVTGTDLSPLNDHPAYKEPVRVTGTTSDTIIVNVGNAGGHANNHTFVSATEDSIDSNALFFSDSARVIKAFTPETATYDPVSGEMVITITDHGMTTGDHIELQPLSFAFSCAHNGGGTDYSPRIGDKAYKLPLEISATTTNTITVNCGNAGSNTDPHTFVSADEGAVVQVGAKEQGTYASRILQKNKAYLQNEVKEWMENTYFVYDNAKCSRDTGLILDAVARDILTDSTVNAYYVGKGYTIGTVGANAVINDQLTQTVGAITWLKGKIATDVLTDATAIARSNTAFDTIIDIMSNGIVGADLPIYGDLTISPEHRQAGKAILTNKAFIQKEIIAFITANYPNFVYNTAACERDMGIFVDLIAWDTQNGSNALSATNSKLYFENAIPVLDDEEVVPTSEAFFFASDLVGQIVRNEVVTPLQGVVTQTIVETTTYTPTTASYDPANGDFVMTMPGHSVSLNDRVTLEPNSFTFTCTMDGDDAAKTYPRAGLDPYALKTYLVKEVTSSTVTLDAAASGPNKYFTPTSANYDAGTGVMIVNVGQHGLRVGNGIVLEDNSFTFTCDQDGNATQHTYPRVGDPLTGKSLSITAVGETQHTPTNAVHSPASGDTTITVAGHGFSNGDYVMIADYGLTYTCVLDGYTVEKGYPRATDFASNRWLEISDVTTDTFKLNVGPSPYNGAHIFVSATANSIRRQTGTMTFNVGNAGSASASVHTFVSATANAMKHEPQTVHTFVSVTADAVNVANMAEAYTPTDVAYDHNSGVMTMTLGTHSFTEKDYVIFAENAITLSCPTSPTDATPINISHPRPTDPIYNKPVRIDSVTPTTITLQVGEARVNKVHSFVSALADGVRRSIKPAIAQHAEKLFADVGGVIRENDGTIPAIVEPAFDTFTANYTLGAEFESIKGQAVKYQTEINEYISEQYNGLAYSLEKCPRDTGYIVDAISEDLEYGGDSATIFNARYYFEGAINVLPQYQREPTRLAFTHLASVMQKVVKNEVQEPIFGTRFTPTNATYDPVTGIMVATIGTHTLTTADHVWFKPNAITFSCDTGSGPTNHASPEAHHRFYNKACPVIGADATTITLWVGNAGAYTGAHTFVSALADGISEINGNLLYQNVSLQAADTATGTIASDLAMVIANIVDDRLVIPDYRGSLDISQRTPKPLPTENLLTKPKADPARTFARKSLQWNRTFIQEEIIQFVRDNNYTFDEAKCARDAGFIIDAVRRDVQTGSTYNGKYIGKSYRIGTVGADKVIEDQLAETIEGIRYVQKDIEAQLSGVALTRAQDSFNNIITSMINDYTPDGTNYNYGVGHISDNHEFAREALQLNREFLKEEATAWVNVNYGGLSYDVNKCKRDTGIMVDAVSYDTQHESNTAMLDVAKLYFENGLSTLSTAQRAPTAALYTHLGAIANQIVLKQTVARSAGNAVVQNTSFGVVTAPIAQHITALWKIVGDLIADDSLINMPDVIEVPTSTAGADGYLYNAEATAIAGRKDNLQGTITQYLRDNFDYLEYDEARCRRDTGYIVDAISHDIQYGGNSAMHGTAELYFKNAVNILPIDQRQSTREAFEYLGKVVRWVTRNEMVPRKEGRKFTPSTATYDPDTGVFTATMANHNLKVGDYVMIAPNSIVFTCSLDGDIALHPSPQSGDPYYNAPMKILSRTGTTITMNVGKVPYGKGGGAHTFVSATMNAITHITGNIVRQEMKHRAARRTIADEAMNLATMLAKVADDNSPANIPSRIDPDTTWVQQDLLTAKDAIDNNSIQMAKDLQIHIGNAYNGISYSKEKCRRDVGVMIDAVSHDVNYTTNYAMIMTAGLYFEGAHSILPADQRQQTAKFFTEMAGVVKSVVQGQTAYQRGFTSTDATYDADTGYFTATIDADHGLEIGDYVSFEPASFTFSCDTGSGPTDHAVPEAHHPYYDVPCPILYVEGNVITMWVGAAASYSGAHTFVSATEGGLKRAVRTWTTQDTSLTAATAVEGEEVADLVRIVEDAIRRDNIDGLPDILEPNTTWVDAGKIEASKIIDDNLDELADDVTKFLKDTFTIIDYSKAKCRRDAGYIIDAMSWDLNYGGNLATRWNADFYYWNNELRIPEDTRVATAKAYRQLGKIVSQVVIGELPGQAIRSELGTTTEEAQAIKLGDILHNVMFYNTPKSLGPIEEPNFEWETSKEFNFAKVILNNNRVKLQREVQRYITSTHKFIDLPKTYRDGGNFIKVLQNDFKGRVIDPVVGTVGSDKASRSFVGALFNIDAQHVFPVFNPPESYVDWRKLRFKGTVTNVPALAALNATSKVWDARIVSDDPNANRYTGSIYVWNATSWVNVGVNNTDLLDSFTGAWTRMKTYINNNIAPDVTHQTMVTELIDNLIIDSVIRPNFLTFGSLVESIAHQFNGASAGVNRNALPLNFRNVGAAIGANASVLSEGGGRIRWSGSDELNNQYFARGLKINGRTGRIEGRPFTSSVRKLARRASNSRASL